MRTLTTLFLFITLFSHAQDKDSVKQYYFRELGWRINLPANLQMMDKGQMDQIYNKGKKDLLKANGLDEHSKVERYKTLIAIHAERANDMDELMNALYF